MQNYNLTATSKRCTSVNAYVISDCGVKRLLGRKLFDTLKPSVEDMSILSLDEDSQVRFVVSLTQDYGEAEHRGRHLCHVFNSDSAAVRTLLVKILIDYTLNYFGFFKTTIEEGHFNESDELRFYKELLTMFNDRFNLANQCVELSSENFFHMFLKLRVAASKNSYKNNYERTNQSKNPMCLNYLNLLRLVEEVGLEGTVMLHHLPK